MRGCPYVRASKCNASISQQHSYRNARLEIPEVASWLLMKTDVEEMRGFSLPPGLCVNELAAEGKSSLKDR